MTMTEPDFAKLFQRPENQDELWLEPRTASVLWLGLDMLATEMTDDLSTFQKGKLESFGDAMWLSRLPRFVWNQNRAWYEGLIDTARLLMDDMASGDIPFPRSLAEEVVLYWAIEVAEGLVGDKEILAKDEKYQALPAEINEFSADDLTFFLFEDQDFHLMFSPRLDGIETVMTNFRPEVWFDWLANAEPRNLRPGLLPTAIMKME